MQFMKIVIAVLFSLIIPLAASAQGGKTGYVDLQRALSESSAGKKAKEKFKVEVESLQSRLKKQKDEIDRLKEQLEKKASVMKAAEREELEDDFRKKMRDFEREYKDSQTDLQKKDSDLTGSILRELQKVIQDIGEREGYSMIVEMNSLLFADKSLDLTERVIDEYDKSR
jgi:outer membrane protein